MSTGDMTTYTDPDLPGMEFGRPPTRPGRPGSADRAVDAAADPPAHDRDAVEAADPPDDGTSAGVGGGTPASTDDVIPDVTADEVGDHGRPDPGERVDEDEGTEAIPGSGQPPSEPVLGSAQIDDLRRRWDTAQAGFVDDPRRAVEVADDMLAEAVAALQAALDGRRRDVAEPWRDDEGASTDALLAAFQQYRATFDRVLSI